MTRGLLRFLRGNTIALLALFLALGGTTYAASTALIGKNTVASPQVVNGSLKTLDLSKKARVALKGNRGPRGFTGAQGAKGATGAQGIQGPPGPFPDGSLPSGKTIRGNYAAAGLRTGGLFTVAYEGISFGFSLAAAPTAHYITGAATPECPGTAAAPTAAAGHLCVYESGTFGSITSKDLCGAGSTCGSTANSLGAWVRIEASADGAFGVRGTWAVTAA
jgi:hypothetical protein